MSFSVRQVDLRKLNSLTKYPSIPTYHTMGPRNGILTEEFIRFEQPVVATEKVDGTNCRMVFLPDRTFLLGSREEFLFARGDLIGNPQLGITEALKATAERLVEGVSRDDAITVYFGELYGGKVTASSKQYTTEQRVGFRLFDVVVLKGFAPLLQQSPEELATWREGGGQPFVDEAALTTLSSAADIPLTPRIVRVEPADLPTSHAAAHEFLKKWIPRSQCVLDDSAQGSPEGLVIRTQDRRCIAKLRYEDYQRTLKRK